MLKLEKKDIKSSLEGLLERIEKREVNVYAHEKGALIQVIDEYKTNMTPMAAYFTLENWLYDGNGRDKPVEMKSAMIWGALWVVQSMGCLDWSTTQEMYGEFMSKQMNLR